MNKMNQLYEGKAKRVYETEDPNLLIVSYKDDATAFNGLKKLATLEFQGDAPEINENAFVGVKADGFYPVENATWTKDLRKNYGGKITNYSLAEGEYVGLPTAEGSWRLNTYTVDEYNALKAQLADGTIVVDNNSDDAVKPTVSDKTTVNYVG